MSNPPLAECLLGRYAHLTTISDFADGAFGHVNCILRSVVFVGICFLSYEQKLEGWRVWRTGLGFADSHAHSVDHVFTRAAVSQSAAS